MSGAAARTGNLKEIYKINNIEEGEGAINSKHPPTNNKSVEN